MVFMQSVSSICYSMCEIYVIRRAFAKFEQSNKNYLDELEEKVITEI